MTIAAGLTYIDAERAHIVRFAPGTQKIVGLTIINACQVLNRDGRLVVNKSRVEASADDLAPALAVA